MDTWEGPHGVTISQCVKCVHWTGGGFCAAFPKGVPMAILANEVDHSDPYPGDGGMRFEKRQFTAQ